MVYIGIDYSLTSPAACSYSESSGDFCFANCNFLVLSDKKIPNKIKNIGLYQHQAWKDPNERYHNIATFLINMHCGMRGDTKIVIEDYSMGSKGKVFHIAENTEVLQYNLWLKGISYTKLPPTSLKKFATGKGNSPKEVMYSQFLKDEGVDLFNLLGVNMPKSGKVDSPISDIVDSYYLCKWAYQNTK